MDDENWLQIPLRWQGDGAKLTISSALRLGWLPVLERPRNHPCTIPAIPKLTSQLNLQNQKLQKIRCTRCPLRKSPVNITTEGQRSSGYRYCNNVNMMRYMRIRNLEIASHSCVGSTHLQIGCERCMNFSKSAIALNLNLHSWIRSELMGSLWRSLKQERERESWGSGSL